MLPSRRFPLTRQSQQSDSQRLINLQFMHSPLGQPGSSAHSLILLYASHTSLRCGAVRYAADTIGLSSHLFPLRLQSIVSLARPNTEEDWHCTAVWAQLCCGGTGLSFPDSYGFPSNLTCCDNLAAAAASPVSMEATLVPSRTGLSCRGTEGPTRATRKSDAGERCRTCPCEQHNSTRGSEALPSAAGRARDAAASALPSPGCM